MVAAAAVAVVVLVTVVLPAEYGIDPLGTGRALGLNALRAPQRTLELADVLKGNEDIFEVEVPDFGEPVPLPNPDVHQDEAGPAMTRTVELTLPPDGETEIKTVLKQNKVVLYTWKTDRGSIYSDFHGHDPATSDELFVRYREDQESPGSSGSLVAPFTGEHGWYWLNYNEFPVKITLNLTGYFDDIVDYGIH